MSRLAHLNAIRWVNGGGSVADGNTLNYALAFPGPAAMGCPDGCEGYELTADLDFDTNGDGSITSADGAGYTIANMMINATDVLNVGLFGRVNGGFIEDVGLISVDLTANYATGDFNIFAVGGLVGSIHNTTTVTASYWDADISGVDDDDDADPPEGKTTLALWEPSDYTGIYAGWNVDVDGQAGADDPWEFGNFCDYPVLKYGSHQISRQRAAAADDFPDNDVTFYSGQTVTLTAGNRGGTAYLWGQIAGAGAPTVTLSGAETAQASFRRPPVWMMLLSSTSN